ncbi:hypothetical protein [Nostoc punctiforme]|nr:hypothetical protein [Nostoc punctiforme]
MHLSSYGGIAIAVASGKFEENAIAFFTHRMTNQSFTNGNTLLISVDADLPVTLKDARAIVNILLDSDRAAYLPEKLTLESAL